MPSPHEFALPDGATLTFLPFGDPDGPLAVVVPGLSDGLAPVFHEPAARAVPAPPRHFRRYRVLVVSHRRPLPPRWTTVAMADDLALLLADSDHRSATLVGHSMGGMVAQHLAARRPELVDRLVLSSTLPRADTGFSARLDRWDHLLRERRFGAFQRDAIDASFTGAERWRRRALLRLSPPDPPTDGLVERHLLLSAACKTHDATGALNLVASPTLVLVGAQDQLTRPAGARALADAIPRASLVVLDRAAHGLPEQRPRAYARAVTAFLEAG